MGKSLVEMAAEIVQSQCATNSMSSEEVSDSLVRTYKTLARLSVGIEGEIETTDAVGMNSGTSSETVPEKPLTEKKPGPRKKGVGKQEKTTVNVSPSESIQRDKIVCLECGKSYKILSSKHLKTHNLSPREYRKKYGYSLRQPLCSIALSEKRKKAGEKRGAPENLLKAIASRKKAGTTKG